MNDPTSPFGFSDYSENPPKHIAERQSSPTDVTMHAGKLEQRVERKKRGRKPQEALPPIKVDLMWAIKAAAILDEEDAQAFEAVVKIMNGRNAASRNRIARAL